MDELASGSAKNRAAVFRATASERGLPPSYVEKDFWVCWSIRRLFAPLLLEGMVFKGGTSLSKVWNAIKRFSEDIDLTLPRSRIPGAERIEFDDTQSKEHWKRSRKAVDAALEAWCAGAGMSAIRSRFTTALGSEDGWALRTSANFTIEFEYPKGLPTGEHGTAYVRPMVRLEFGALMPTVPSEDHEIEPYSTRAGEYVMKDPSVRVRVLAPERTFWEKVTLIHVENCRPTSQEEIPSQATERQSRHYADVAELFKQEIGLRALGKMEILKLVSDEKNRFYPRSWANYDGASKGQLVLVPSPAKEKELRSDYQRMRDMYYEEPLPFHSILERLRELQEIVADDAFFRS